MISVEMHDKQESNSALLMYPPTLNVAASLLMKEAISVPRVELVSSF